MSNQSRIAVVLSHNNRVVELVIGWAWFDVPSDV